MSYVYLNLRQIFSYMVVWQCRWWQLRWSIFGSWSFHSAV